MKIHVILNSHLDPVWLWNACQGIDEVISTAESNCNLLEDYPEAVITRGEAWFYEILDQYAPAVFNKVKKYVQTGRWQVVGNWYIQPDCNFPDAYSFSNQSLVSKPIWDKLGVTPTVGYNVDSFGHTASLPDFYAACGVDSYIMMRPMEHEMHLPFNIFIWESPRGNRVMTCRIPNSYSTWGIEHLKGQLEIAIKTADPAIGHNICFVGLGDHGGGPIRSELDWLREHKNDYPGVTVEISSPRQFFDAITEKRDQLPVFKGELQQHAIGCYSILHEFKRKIRKIEPLLSTCDNLMHRFPGESRKLPEFQEFDNIKKLFAFNMFHDILAGTCIKSAYELADADLGRIYSVAQRFIYGIARLLNQSLSRDKRQQLILDNFSKNDFSGMFFAEPWLGYETSPEYQRFTLRDEKNQIIPHQIIAAE